MVWNDDLDVVGTSNLPFVAVDSLFFYKYQSKEAYPYMDPVSRGGIELHCIATHVLCNNRLLHEMNGIQTT